MLIATGEICPGCGRVIEPTDDVVPVTPYEAGCAGAVVVGAYHRGCLALIPERERVAAKWRDNLVAALRRRADAGSIAVIGQGHGFVIVFTKPDERIMLCYLNQMAHQRFTNVAQWRDFVALVKGFDPDSVQGPHEASSKRGASTLALRSTDGVGVSWVEPVSLEIDFAKADFADYVARFGPLRGEVDFAELAATGKLCPVEVEGSLAKNRGVVRDVRTVGGVSVVTFDALKRTELLLTVAEFRELQRVATGVKV